jgi:DNA-3-methyladenine glycosylase II
MFAAMVLSLRQADGTVDLEKMGALGDSEVTAALTAVPGIGLWSAQTFLLRQLHQPDALPAGDTGIRRAVAGAWALAFLLTPGQVEGRAAAWAPYRSYASALLWKSLRPPGEPSDPKAHALSAGGRGEGVTRGTALRGREGEQASVTATAVLPRRSGRAPMPRPGRAPALAGRAG